MSKQDRTFSQHLARQIRIRDLQGRWRRVASLSLDDFEQLWNKTAGGIRESQGFGKSNDESDVPHS
jgi:hypothetical protein